MSKHDAATVPAITDDSWKDEIYQAGEEVIRAQIEGKDTEGPMKRFAALREKLPPHIKKKLTGPTDPELVFKLLKGAYEFSKVVSEFRNRIR